jgi:hypothetical protein
MTSPSRSALKSAQVLHSTGINGVSLRAVRLLQHNRRQPDIADRGLRHLSWADSALLRDSAGTLRGLAKRPSLYPLGAALVELVRGLLQDILQIFVELPSNDIDSFIAKMSEGRNRPIVFKCNAILGTFQKQDPNGGVESS